MLLSISNRRANYPPAPASQHKIKADPKLHSCLQIYYPHYPRFSTPFSPNSTLALMLSCFFSYLLHAFMFWFLLTMGPSTTWCCHCWVHRLGRLNIRELLAVSEQVKHAPAPACSMQFCPPPSNETPHVSCGVILPRNRIERLVPP